MWDGQKFDLVGGLVHRTEVSARPPEPLQGAASPSATHYAPVQTDSIAHRAAQLARHAARTKARGLRSASDGKLRNRTRSLTPTRNRTRSLTRTRTFTRTFTLTPTRTFTLTPSLTLTRQAAQRAPRQPARRDAGAGQLPGRGRYREI